MYKILLCLRYLRTRYIALASIISVMLGVATMIVVNSVMAGFSNEMRDRLHGFLADIVVEARSMDGIVDARRQMAIVEDAAGEYIHAMTPVVEVPGMITYKDPVTQETLTQPVTLVGIDPVGKSNVGPLRSCLDSYNPVMEGGVVVREPLRGAADELGWELTDVAAEYRKWRVEEDRRLLIDEGLMSPLDAPAGAPADDSRDAVPAPVFDDGPVDAAATDVAATGRGSDQYRGHRRGSGR